MTCRRGPFSEVWDGYLCCVVCGEERDNEDQLHHVDDWPVVAARSSEDFGIGQAGGHQEVTACSDEPAT
jgi:hypothetical protein